MLEKLSIRLLNLYQIYLRHLSPALCRFTPSCSEYAKQAILKYGFFLGAVKALKRLLLCQPFSAKAGYDPLL